MRDRVSVEMDHGHVRLLMTKVENAGILVVRNGIVGNNTRRKLSVEEFRGFVLADEYAPLIFINGSDGKAAQMFTIAHELAHIWYGESAAFDLSGLQPSAQEIERICKWEKVNILISQKKTSPMPRIAGWLLLLWRIGV